MKITQVLISDGNQRINPPVRQDTSTIMETFQSLSQKAEEARDRLDAHVREIVQWHFSPETRHPVLAEICGDGSILTHAMRSEATTT